MKDSLFVFQKGAIDSSSVTENNLGTNLDFFAVPVSSLTSISAIEGKIVLYFRSSNVFENSKANQAKVTLNTTQGSEPRAAIDAWALTLEEGKVYVFDDAGSTYPSIFNDVISSIDSIIRPTTERFTSGGGGATTIDVLSSTDVVLGTLDSSVPDTVKLMNAVLSYAKVGSQGQVTTTAVTPSGICYKNPVPLFNASFTTGDSWSNYLLGNYDRTSPVYPVSTAQIDYAATQADVRATPATGTSGTDNVAPTVLKHNNEFGNKIRYTDDAGNGSDASVGSDIWAHVNWNGHSWAGATTGYVIDHLTGYGYNQSYLLDGTKFNMSTANGQSWALWMAYINGIGTYLGYTGWMIIDGSDINGAQGVKCQPAMVWADNFFNLERSDNRGSFLTGENASSTLYYNINDSGNDDMMLDISKTTSSGFSDVITNIFIKRKHY
jgi:hypothetical protein